MFILLCILGFWVLCSTYCVNRFHADWPELEQRLIREDDFYSALGGVPTKHRNIIYIFIAILGPIVAFSLWMGDFSMWRHKRKCRRLLSKLDAELAEEEQTKEILEYRELLKKISEANERGELIRFEVKEIEQDNMSFDDLIVETEKPIKQDNSNESKGTTNE